MRSDIQTGPADRFTMRRLAQGGNPDAFANDVRAGLTASPKFLFPKYFYDDLGSKLFEAICRLPEYYLTRAEREILSTYAREIAGSIEGPVRLMELGSGSSEKTRYLIEALLERQGDLHYLPIDISGSSLEASSLDLLKAYPRLRITAYASDYFTALRAIAEAEATGRTIALFLGSNIGNFDPEEARDFFRAVRDVLRPEDALLVGADLKKSAEVLVPAYDDPLGVTAAFNLNQLARINRELGGEFDVRKFAHRVLYNDELGRMELYLVSLANQAVRIRDLDIEVSFGEGETIYTESSYKFDLEQLAELARAPGFSLERTWYDDARRYSFNLLAAAERD
jgi:L-histidine N-alpha-methyltransferase